MYSLKVTKEEELAFKAQITEDFKKKIVFEILVAGKPARRRYPFKSKCDFSINGFKLESNSTSTTGRLDL